MFSKGMTISAPSASITRWRASSASLMRAAMAPSLSEICCGNSTTFLEPSTKWMMSRRCSAMPGLPDLHRLEIAAAQRDALADAEAMGVLAAQRAGLADVHRHGHFVGGRAQALLHLRRAARAETPALGATAVVAKLRHRPHHPVGVEPGRAARRGARRRVGVALVHLADRAHLSAHEAGLRQRRERHESEQGDGRAHRYSEIVWM